MDQWAWPGRSARPHWPAVIAPARLDSLAIGRSRGLPFFLPRAAQGIIAGEFCVCAPVRVGLCERWRWLRVSHEGRISQRGGEIGSARESSLADCHCRRGDAFLRVCGGKKLKFPAIPVGGLCEVVELYGYLWWGRRYWNCFCEKWGGAFEIFLAVRRSFDCLYYFSITLDVVRGAGYGSVCSKSRVDTTCWIL